MDTCLPPLFQREGHYYLLGDFTLGKSVSVDKDMCDGCGSKDIKCTYFGFIILSPCLGTNRSGKESPKFIILLTAFRTVCGFKGTISFLSLFFHSFLQFVFHRHELICSIS